MENSSSRPDHPSLLVFQAVDNYQKPIWPWEKDKQAQMMHFDFYVENLEEAVEHAKSCGATVSEVQYFNFEGGSVVMFDPAGHPFCLSLQDMIMNQFVLYILCVY